MKPWLSAALDYLPRWLSLQMKLQRQPGCSLAVAQHGRVLLECAFGHADLATGQKLTPRHRFRVASHSKTFTTAAVLQLRQQGRWTLDQPVGQFVGQLHPDVAALTLAQLLSHSGGLVRDGRDAGQWQDRRPFLDERALRADLADGGVIPADSRFKYSNHGFGLLGLAIAAVTGEPYEDWVSRELVQPLGLTETTPDMPTGARVLFAKGHSSLLPLDRRVVIPGDNRTHSLASATGFVSTAADLARFYGGLAPDAPNRVLTPASRRAMAARRWRDPHSSIERWYGLGTISGTLRAGGGDWEWFGHSGGFQGTVSYTRVLPQPGLSVSVLTNAADGMAHAWIDGALQVLRAFERHGGPSRRTAAWSGRWWSLWGATDLLPMRDRVLVANPALANPVLDASELSIERAARDGTAHARIALAGGYASHGEPARLERDAKGRASSLWLGGTQLQPEATVARTLRRRYQQAG